MEAKMGVVTIESLKALGALLPTPVVVMNFKRVLYMNEAFEKLTGYTLEAINDKGFLEILEPKQVFGFYKKFSRALKGQPYEDSNAFSFRCSDDQWIWVDYKSRSIVVDDEVYLFASLMDITEKMKLAVANTNLLKLRDAMLKLSQEVIKTTDIEAFYHMVLSCAIDAIPSAKLGTVLIKKNQSLVVAAQEGFEPKSIEAFRIPISDAFIYKATDGKLDRVVKIDDIIFMQDYHKVNTKAADQVYIRSTISAPIFISGAFFGTLSVDSTDTYAFTEEDVELMTFMKNHVEMAISNHLLYQEKLYLSSYDGLTGLYNRSCFEELFKQEREKAVRYGETFQMVVMDMNDLKQINDAYGHLVGDEVIKHFASSCLSVIRKSDVLSRYGGDEFVGLFFSATKEDLNKRLNAHLLSIFNAPIVVQGVQIRYSFSYGIATFMTDGTDLDELFKIADERMYAFKAAFKSNKELLQI